VQADRYRVSQDQDWSCSHAREGENMTVSKWIPTTDLMMLRRMGKLQEELAELANVAARCIIQGIDEVDPGTGRVNRARLTDELADVLAQCHVTILQLELDFPAISLRCSHKMENMWRWEAMFLPESDQKGGA
jgi:NTP pyrophosphatase (non-canonical NTP hydrolase)